MENDKKIAVFGDYIQWSDDKNYFIPPEKKTADLLKPSALFVEEGARNKDAVLADVKKFSGAYWFQSDPILAGYVDELGNAHLFFLNDTPENLIYLLEVWDFTNPYSISVVSVLKNLLSKYGGAGLRVIGIHASKYEFSKNPEIVRAAAFRAEINFPFVVDHDFAVSRALEVRHTPQRILFDSEKALQFRQIGHLGHDILELEIQKALRGMSPGLPCPRVPASKINYKIYHDIEKTPDIYFDINTKLGNKEKLTNSGLDVTFTCPENAELALHTPYLKGPWSPLNESIYMAAGPYNKGTFQGPSSIKIPFMGSSAYIVAGTRFFMQGATSETKIEILLDGRPVKPENRGADLKNEGGKRTTLVLNDPRLFQLVRKCSHKRHILEIFVDPSAIDNFQIFAIHFTRD